MPLRVTKQFSVEQRQRVEERRRELEPGEQGENYAEVVDREETLAVEEDQAPPQRKKQWKTRLTEVAKRKEKGNCDYFVPFPVLALSQA